MVARMRLRMWLGDWPDHPLNANPAQIDWGNWVRLHVAMLKARPGG